ncbi:MAG: hypothetical protein ACRD96_18825, partial [Bryobacteraceae bacterium]
RTRDEPSTSHCTASSLQITPSTISIGFVAAGGLPVPLEARVADNCGVPLTNANAAVSVSFSTNAPAPVNLVHLADGRWSGTWQVAQTASTAVSLTFLADDPDRNLSGTKSVDGNIDANPDAPVIADTPGVVSSASQSPGLTVAPGGIVTLYGQRLATGSTQSSVYPVPTTLGSSSVAVAGRAMPVFFAADLTTFSQINAMLPYDLPLNTPHSVSARRGNRRSNFVDVLVTARQPAVYTVTGTGSGQGHLYDVFNPLIVADRVNPISRGGYLIIYLEGLGAVTPAIEAGVQVPGLPLREVAGVSVTIGGQPGTVLFAGLTPFLSGLNQINVEVPASVTPGDAVPVVVTVGGQSSPPVTIAVR